MLEQRAVLLERLLQLDRHVGRAEAAPGNEVRVGRDRGGRVDLQQGQPLHDLQQVGRSRCVEQLRPHGDATGLLFGEPVHVPQAMPRNQAPAAESCEPERPQDLAEARTQAR